HEFLPDRHQIEAEVERARVEMTDDLEELEKTLERVRSLEEGNPMLGTRGVRLGLLHPEIYEMQCRAIFRAARTAESAVEIMVPLVAYAAEFGQARADIERIATDEGLPLERLRIGTMIELPR